LLTFPATTPPARAGVYALFLDSLGSTLKSKMLAFKGLITLFKINTREKKGQKVKKVVREGLSERAKEQLRSLKPAPKIGNGEELLPEEDLGIGAMNAKQLEQFLCNEVNLKKLSRFDYYMTGQVNCLRFDRLKPTKPESSQTTTGRTNAKQSHAHTTPLFSDARMTTSGASSSVACEPSGRTLPTTSRWQSSSSLQTGRRSRLARSSTPRSRGQRSWRAGSLHPSPPARGTGPERGFGPRIR
jgi:hypothetical protein